MSATFNSPSRTASAIGALGSRLTDLIMLMADLHAGEEVHASRIKDLLTPGEWRRFRLRMHGPSLPVIPSAEALGCLHVYRQRLKKADDLYGKANARKRKKTMIGPDLFREAETAYAAALEALEETLDDHPYLADYLSPYPDFSDWRIRSTKCGVPRIRNILAEAPARVYSRKTGEEYVFTAIEIIRGITRRDLRRLKRSKAAGSSTTARQ
jgi:hypothetical protein